MSYSAADLINDLELSADTYGVPRLPPRDLAALGKDPSSEHDGDRTLAERGASTLAERGASALAERQDFGAALVAFLAYIDELANDCADCYRPCDSWRAPFA